MPYKDPDKRKEKQKEYGKRWYQKNREKHITTSRVQKQRARESWIAFKSQFSCAHCGVKHPAVIDFHHLVRDETYQSVFQLAANGAYKAAREEASKCLALCANCHRLLHFEEISHRRRRRNKKRKKKKHKRQP